MFDLFRLWFGVIVRTVRSRRGLILENLALRQQLIVLKRKHTKPRLNPLDKIFWVVARRFWSRWEETLLLVLPETVARRHRAGFNRTGLCCARVETGLVAAEDHQTDP
jgi:hypothetical protein